MNQPGDGSGSAEVAIDGAAIAARWATVRAEIERAARAVGREPSSVLLVAVSKLHPVAAIAAALDAGQRDFGENYAQELRDKARAVAAAGGAARWHFIGPLQRNKVKYVVGVAGIIHTIDGASLGEEIARRAAVMGTRQRCLIEVNVGAEPQKAGCLPDEVPALVDLLRAHESLQLDGLMCIPPAGDPGQTRLHFRRLAQLRADERTRTGLPLPELSMGMSADYGVAIEEGSTIVRVGTAIFGERPAQVP